MTKDYNKKNKIKIFGSIFWNLYCVVDSGDNQRFTHNYVLENVLDYFEKSCRYKVKKKRIFSNPKKKRKIDEYYTGRG